jgi:hypothetical protein
MSKDLSSQAAAFLAGFVTPLCAGGELKIGPAIDAARARAFVEVIESGALAGDTEAIDAARAAVAAQMVVRPPRLELGGDELRLCLALYNALALAHPDLDSWTARSGKRAAVLEVSLELAKLPLALDRRTLLARHTLLARLHVAARQDVRVRWWTGRAEFKGRTPPARLTLWPTVRAVRVEHELIPLSELLGFEEGQRLLATLYDASPLTDLLHPERSAPGFSWASAGILAILRDAELARHVVHSWISPERAPLVLPAAAAAWERLLGQQAADIPHLRAVTAFLTYVGVLASMAESPLTAENGRDAPGVGLFWALPEIAARVAPELAWPPGLETASPRAGRWSALRLRGLSLVGNNADRLTAMLGSRLNP